MALKEQEIIQLIKSGNEKGVEELLRYYGPLLKYIISPILSNEKDKEECLSEIVQKVWWRIGTYDETRGSWNAWLTALARNTALNRVRNVKMHASWEEMPEQMPSLESTPEEIVLKKERQQELITALQILSVEERKLFYRKYYYLQSTEQIASELGMTNRAVEGRLYRLKKRLRAKLGGGFDVE